MYLRRAGLLFAWMAILAGTGAIGVRAQEVDATLEQRAKTKVQPSYPELARKLNLSGTVKVQVVVAPNGTVKDAKILGGNPVLANGALDAARKWRFEPGPQEATGVLSFKFEPRQ